MADFTEIPMRMSGSYSEPTLELLCAIIEEGINQQICATVEFTSENREVELKDIVGTTINLEMEIAEDEMRQYFGMCISAQFLGSHSGIAHFSAEIRPWLWFLTRSQECRVYQNKSAPDIILEILGDYGFSADVEDLLTGTYHEREYCVQYRETDLDFIHRLMEEEGCYYFFEQEQDKVKMKLADSVSAHSVIEGDSKLEFHDRDEGTHLQKEYIYEWNASEHTYTGKVTLNDYNFEKPKADLKASSSIAQGKHSYKDYEVYDYPGHYRETSDGDRLARVIMESKAAHYQKWKGVANVPTIAVGRRFTLEEHPRSKDETEFMVTKATHFLRVNTTIGAKPEIDPVLGPKLGFEAGNTDGYRVVFEAVPAETQFRPEIVTPWPEISSIQTAVVTGPAGEEIHTDKYGRIRVQFHWDRIGENDDKSSCWVRTMMPWTGKKWGEVAFPRIGNEVVIQFEEGDPDRPVCIGMLYNADNMPPYELPADKTRSGIKTNSSKGSQGYNELMFEDKKGEELIRLEAEKDYTQLVQNSAHKRIGYPHEKDTLATAVKNPATGGSDLDESMMLEIKKDLVEIMEEGDHYFEVKAGQQDIKVKKDKTEDIEGKLTETVTKDVIRTITTGDLTETVKEGNVTRETATGNEKNTIKTGNYELKTSAGMVELDAATKIKLTCGGSTIEMTPSQIKISSLQVMIDAKGLFEAKAGMTATVKGSGMVMVQGGLVKIN